MVGSVRRVEGGAEIKPGVSFDSLLVCSGDAHADTGDQPKVLVDYRFS